MNITGLCRIFKKELNGKELYSTTISSKNQNGEWDKMYLSVQLPKKCSFRKWNRYKYNKRLFKFL